MGEHVVSVMQLTCELAPAGAERIVYELARGVKAAGGTSSVVSIKPATGAVAGWLADEGIDVLDLGVTSRFDFGAKKRFAEILRRRQPGILHTHMYHANVLGRSAAAAIERMGVVSNLHVVERRFRPWRKWLEKANCRRADRIVCVSEAVQRYARDEMGLPADRLTVIHNGIDPARIEPTADRSDVLLRIGVDPESHIVGFLGRLDRQKGPDILVRAAPHFLARYADTRVVMVGSGPMASALRRQAKELGYERRFVWVGHREDIGNLLQCFDVFAFPSRWEGFGLSLVEAMMAGRPAVAANVDSVPEIIEDGRTALAVPPGDHVKLGRAITYLLENRERAKELGDAARVRATELFGLERMVSRYVYLYGGIAGWRQGKD